MVQEGRAASATDTSMRHAMVILALSLSSWAAAGSAVAQTTTQRDRAQARALFVAGQAAVDSGRWTDAHESFRRAYDLTGAPSALFNAAFALRALGRYQEAALAFQELLGLRNVDRPMLAEARGYLAEVRDRIARIELEGLPLETTTVRLDAVGLIDDGARPLVLRMDPGRHALDVSLLGHARFEWAGEVTDGQTLHLVVSLPAEAPASVFEDAWFWVVVGLAVAGVGAVVAGVVADDAAQVRPPTDTSIVLRI